VVEGTDADFAAAGDAFVAADDTVAGVTSYWQTTVPIKGNDADVFALTQERGALELALVDGRAAQQPGEAVLGPSLMDDAGVEVGDTLVLGSGDGEVRVHVVGEAVFPLIGNTSFGGQLLTDPDTAAKLGADPLNRGYLIDLAPGADQHDVESLAGGSLQVQPPFSPPGVQRLLDAVGTDTVLAGFLAGFGLVVFGFGVGTASRRQRLDYAVVARARVPPAPGPRRLPVAGGADAGDRRGDRGAGGRRPRSARVDADAAPPRHRRRLRTPDPDPRALHRGVPRRVLRGGGPRRGRPSDADPGRDLRTEVTGSRGTAPDQAGGANSSRAMLSGVAEREAGPVAGVDDVAVRDAEAIEVCGPLDELGAVGATEGDVVEARGVLVEGGVAVQRREAVEPEQGAAERVHDVAERAGVLVEDGFDAEHLGVQAR
jgi:hypothetical protein